MPPGWRQRDKKSSIDEAAPLYSSFVYNQACLHEPSGARRRGKRANGRIHLGLLIAVRMAARTDDHGEGRALCRILSVHIYPLGFATTEARNENGRGRTRRRLEEK